MNCRTLKVLLLEDNPDHAELIETALKAKDERFQLDTSQTKEEFMARLNRKDYDTYLIDYNIPGEDSLEILEELTTMGHHVPVIFISGTEDEELITQVLHAGAADFIVKSRSTLKTLPIIVKRNIIRKMTFQEKEPFLPSRIGNLGKNLEDSLKKISNVSAQLTKNLRKGYLSFSEMKEVESLEDLLEKANHLLKYAKQHVIPRIPTPRFKREKSSEEKEKSE